MCGEDRRNIIFLYISYSGTGVYKEEYMNKLCEIGAYLLEIPGLRVCI